MPVTTAHANAFAARWYAAWNSGSVPRVVACYAPDAELLSPLVGVVLGVPSEAIRGRAALERYVGRTFSRFPGLRLDPRLLLVGADGVSLQYDMTGGLVAMESLRLDGELRVVRASAHYATVLRSDLEGVGAAPSAIAVAVPECIRSRVATVRRPGWRA